MAVPAASFLGLPASIRREIYILAGLSKLCPLAIVEADSGPERYKEPPLPGSIPRNPYVPGSRYECRYKRLLIGRLDAIYRSGPDCLCPDMPKQLLLVNKAIYNETHAILYGENGFVVRAHKAKDLDVLRSLSGRSINMMTSLMVRLNSWPCPRGHDQTNFKVGKCILCKTPTLSISDPPLRTGNSSSEDMAQAWEEVCRILASNVAAGQLGLTLICDVDNIDIAKRILQPLEKIPQLKSCAIRLGRNRNDELRSLASTASLKLTAANQLAEQPSFRKSFSDLPAEIRLRILEFTHLGKQGDFSTKDHKLHNGIVIEKKTMVVRPDPRQLILTKMCCNACTFTKLDCCCPLRYAAYSPTCQCRVLPLELLLVSRQMDMDASEILYSTNTFVFRQSFDDTLSFLQSLRPSTLKLFRRITFQLEATQTGNWSVQQEAWSSLIRFIGSSFSVSKLVVTINPFEDDETAMWADEDPRVADAMHDTYVGVARVVKDLLSGLRGYHMNLVVHSELASSLEEEVMGPEWGVTKHRQLIGT